jgi:hypothetical protein
MTNGEPISYRALAVGTDVMNIDGTSIGTVEHVLQEPDLDLFDGIVIATSAGIRFVDPPSSLRSREAVGTCRRDAGR